ncbi:long-chain fatty acid--CoA ligase [Sphingomonas populi]|uniref:Long-chain-fatty-acid--CoA ligase n=2 Tax=Sphingomonas populi TaxID=2484750 RepID=A0A4Q6Y5M6_9SPHN|nr:long-chain fatty acid--CoA ligase [Sphingomonas populi]
MTREICTALAHFNTLSQFFEYQCSRFADRAAVFQRDRVLSYTELWRDADYLGGYLQRHCSVEPDSRVAVMLPNQAEFVVATCAIQRVGAVQVNVNPHYVPRELHHQLSDAGASVIILSAETLAILEAAKVGTLEHAIVIDLENPPGSLPPHGRQPMWLSSYGAALAMGESVRAVPLRSRDDLAFLQYTGGTTGQPKGAMLSHGNILSNIEQVSQWLQEDFGRRTPVALTAIPLYHIFALTVNMFTVMAWGGSNVLIRNPRDSAGLLAEWDRHPVNFVTGVNTLFKSLLSTRDLAAVKIEPDVLTMGGGATIQRSVSDAWETLTGRPIVEGYGLSETSPVLTCMPASERRFRGGIGLPVPGTEIVIRGPDDKDLIAGQVGELCARGPQVMRGYWRQPEATARAITGDGFFRTGDLAVREADGYLRIVDRAKDMILVSGFNVYPNEIEETVAAVAAVAECACVGVQDEKTGEAVALFVKPSVPGLSEATILAHCRANLTPYKVPVHIFIVDAIPQSAVGKILRHMLRLKATELIQIARNP